jgi:hypothetical protein
LLSTAAAFVFDIFAVTSPAMVPRPWALLDCRRTVTIMNNAERITRIERTIVIVYNPLKDVREIVSQTGVKRKACLYCGCFPI